MASSKRNTKGVYVGEVKGSRNMIKGKAVLTGVVKGNEHHEQRKKGTSGKLERKQLGIMRKGWCNSDSLEEGSTRSYLTVLFSLVGKLCFQIITDS